MAQQAVRRHHRAKLQAIVAFGGQAQEALRLWSSPSDVPAFEVPHPSSRDPRRLVDEWRQAVDDLRTIATSDPSATGSANYATAFKEGDYTRIPPRDLPFGMPAWFGDDAWGRKAKPRHNNCADRPSSDMKNTLVWRAPKRVP